jgi:hypothetical protein
MDNSKPAKWLFGKIDSCWSLLSTEQKNLTNELWERFLDQGKLSEKDYDCLLKLKNEINGKP